MTKPDPIALINAASSDSMRINIASQDNPDPRKRRAIDFELLDSALEAVAALIAKGGPAALHPDGDSMATKHAHLQSVAEAAAPYRPKARELRRA